MKALKTIAAMTTLFLSIGALAGDAPPGAVAEFCSEMLHGDIAGVNQPFNATDIAEKGKPTRRILAYSVTSTTSYLWYEHGGRGYHQHLVVFNSAKPEEIKASYVFVRTLHKHIHGLIRDREFLLQHISKNREL